MHEIYKITDIVKDTLQEYPNTRNSDSELYMYVCRRINPAVEVMGFGYVMNNINSLGIPKFESVRRARQKTQADNPELRACEAVTDGRYENWKEIREYAVT